MTAPNPAYSDVLNHASYDGALMRPDREPIHDDERCTAGCGRKPHGRDRLGHALCYRALNDPDDDCTQPRG